MTSRDAVRRMIEDEITLALDGATVSDALGALTEIQAQVLADRGIVPGTEAFTAFVATSSIILAARVETLAREAKALAH